MNAAHVICVMAVPVVPEMLCLKTEICSNALRWIRDTRCCIQDSKKDVDYVCRR